MNANISLALANWIPYKLSFSESGPYCEWLYTGGEDFTEPFFDDKTKRNACNTRTD